MLKYLTLGSNDIKRSKKFYDAALKPLGIKRLATKSNELGYGPAKQVGESLKRLWIVSPVLKLPATWGNGTMVAFDAESRAAVRAFYREAINAGGFDEGKPGLRPYSPNFYACYVRDPDGNKLSAVCDKPE
jgi:predicted lactoylglutathione lyase